MELVKQEMRRQEKDVKELMKKLASLEEENSSLKESRNVEQKLNSSIMDLEDQLSEKNKVKHVITFIKWLLLTT